MAKLDSNIRESLMKVWNLTRNNEKLRDGEKASILRNLKEIDFLWGFGK